MPSSPSILLNTLAQLRRRRKDNKATEVEGLRAKLVEGEHAGATARVQLVCRDAGYLAEVIWLLRATMGTDYQSYSEQANEVVLPANENTLLGLGLVSQRLNRAVFQADVMAIQTELRFWDAPQRAPLWAKGPNGISTLQRVRACNRAEKAGA